MQGRQCCILLVRLVDLQHQCTAGYHHVFWKLYNQSEARINVFKRKHSVGFHKAGVCIPIKVHKQGLG
jgi:hypothetical protein